MNRGVIKAISLVITFVVAVIVLEFLFNRSGEDLTSSMGEATLPVLYFEQEGSEINPLFGYTKQMNPVHTRDTITPLYGNLSLPIRIATYGKKITGLRYEVRTLDSSRLIEETKVKDLRKQKDSVYATLPIQNLLDANAEYQLCVHVYMGKKQVYYYTRIMQEEGMNVMDCVAFARDFHKKTFNRDYVRDLTKYMEPDSSRTNDNLNRTSIHSSVDELFWGKFEAKTVGELQVSIKEAKKEFTVMILSYVLTAKGDNGEPQHYNVQEYYRIRYGADRMYLLDFERTVNEIFAQDGDNFTENAVNLGIRDSQVNYMSNETGTIVGFVQQGDLWQYNNVNRSLVKVFSFRGLEEIDTRENNSQHSIRIIRVDETGSMDFIVYGYMNRGEHEGEVGIAAYHYDSIGNAIEELVWIPSSKSYQMMEQIVGKVLYVNDKDELYLMAEGVIYKIQLKEKEKYILEKGSGEDWFAISTDKSHLAWLEGGDANKGTKLHLCNMATGKTRTIVSAEDEYIRPLGFLDGDLIYGIARKKQVSTGISGVTVFPMYTVKIVGDDGNVKKEYQKSGRYVIGARVDNYTIYLSRAKYQNGSYVSTSGDTIMNMALDDRDAVSLSTIRTEKKQTQVVIQMTSEIADQDPNLLAAKIVDDKDDHTVEIEQDGEEHYYYAYAKGRVMMISPRAADAVKAAAQETGIVIDDKAHYIWQQAKSTAKDTMAGMHADTGKVGKKPTERALSVILKHEGISLSVGELLENGSTAKKILENSLKNATVLDLTGCDLDSMFYYVSQGFPVYAMASATKPVLICGYSKSNVVLYDPVANETKSYSLAKTREMFKKAGNIFLSYVIEEEH
ncbi:hypothetical protein SAMN02910358_01085 [Lachnospiraceae bacterium XBB1006]|nr:hypothetical protein SAMN02910358_01085 [Lachnospiraceae bacterium XBB1006]